MIRELFNNKRVYLKFGPDGLVLPIGKDKAAFLSLNELHMLGPQKNGATDSMDRYLFGSKAPAISLVLGAGMGPEVG